MSDSNESDPLSLVVATLGLNLDLRFLDRGPSDPEGSERLSSVTWKFHLDFRLDFLFGLLTGDDESEWSSALLVPDRDRIGST